MKRMALLLAILCMAGDCYAAPGHRCEADALKQARKLLTFHFGPDDRMAIDKAVKVLPPIRNPAGKGSFDVLEIYGHIYKGTYRMHLIYGQLPGECILVGQEVLEITNL
jgi:hypothetical protein